MKTCLLTFGQLSVTPNYQLIIHTLSYTVESRCQQTPTATTYSRTLIARRTYVDIWISLSVVWLSILCGADQYPIMWSMSSCHQYMRTAGYSDIVDRVQLSFDWVCTVINVMSLYAILPSWEDIRLIQCYYVLKVFGGL
jgi:hypothetical protein